MMMNLKVCVRFLCSYRPKYR